MTVRTPTIAGQREAGRITRVRALIGAGLALSLALIVGVVIWQARGDDTATVESPIATTSAPVAPPVATSSSDTASQSVVIVASQEHADRLQAALAEADAVRDHMGLAPLQADIIVVSSEAEAERIIAATNDVNVIRAAEGLPEIQVTDLR
jgi:hypothetical protein